MKRSSRKPLQLLPGTLSGFQKPRCPRLQKSCGTEQQYTHTQGHILDHRQTHAIS